MSRLATLMLAMSLPGPVSAADPVPEVIAHRGASYDAPENTIAAIRLAWDQNADGSEFDVYLSKDRQVVVIHDKDTKRTAGTNLAVAESTCTVLRGLDVGAWKGTKFADQRIPTLAEMLATVPAGKRAFVEVKCGPEIVPELLRGLAKSGIEPERTPVISFNADVIASVKVARPDVPAYWLVNLNRKDARKRDLPPPTPGELIAKARMLGADGLDLSASETLDDRYAKAIKEAGLGLYVWTVNDPAVAKRMVKIGVDGITTDRPGWLRERLTELP